MLISRAVEVWKGRKVGGERSEMEGRFLGGSSARHRTRLVSCCLLVHSYEITYRFRSISCPIVLSYDLCSCPNGGEWIGQSLS